MRHVPGGFTCLASIAARPPGKERTLERCRTPETVFGRPCMLSPLQGRSREHCRLGLCALLAHPFARRPFARSRQSRGLRNRSDDGFRARSRTPSGLAAGPENEIRDAFDPFLLPYTLQRAPVPRLFPAHRPRVFLARAPDGLPPTETGDRAFHDAPNRFGGSRALVVMACWALPGFSWPQVFPWATTPCDRTSDAPVATLADAGARIFSRCARADSTRTAKTASTPLS